MTGSNEVAIMAGRLNPPTKGHAVLGQKLIAEAKAKGIKPLIFIVDGEKSGQDKTKNPLTGMERLELVQKLFPGIKVDVVSSAYEVLEVLDLQGLKPSIWVAGSDRASNYRKLVGSEQLSCEIVEVDREAGDADGVSATAARKAALEGDMVELAHHMPDSMSPSDLADIAKRIRDATDTRANCRD
jgi:nicotinamide mononucleotide adenylyltransferase